MLDQRKWKAATHPLISLREMKLKGGKKIELAHLERPFVVVDKEGKPVALFAAASINEPTKDNTGHPAFEYNTFNISFRLR